MNMKIKRTVKTLPPNPVIGTKMKTEHGTYGSFRKAKVNPKQSGDACHLPPIDKSSQKVNSKRYCDHHYEIIIPVYAIKSKG